MKDLVAPAEHVYDVNDWETTYDASDVFSLLTDNLRIGEIMKVGRLKVLPPIFAASVPTEWEDGEAVDWEVKLFATRAEAEAACKEPRL